MQANTFLDVAARVNDEDEDENEDDEDNEDEDFDNYQSAVLDLYGGKITLFNKNKR